MLQVAGWLGVHRTKYCTRHMLNVSCMGLKECVQGTMPISRLTPAESVLAGNRHQAQRAEQMKTALVCVSCRPSRTEKGPHNVATAWGSVRLTDEWAAW